MIGIFGIPREIFQLITNHIDDQSLLKMSLICKSWKEYVESVMMVKCEQHNLDLKTLETELPVTLTFDQKLKF